MSETNFKILVRDMRTAQKEYFKSRSAASLTKSKSLEREVDYELSKEQNPTLEL